MTNKISIAGYYYSYSAALEAVPEKHKKDRNFTIQSSKEATQTRWVLLLIS